MNFATWGLLICLVLVEVSDGLLAYVPVLMIIIFVVGFATGPGSIPW